MNKKRPAKKSTRTARTKADRTGAHDHAPALTEYTRKRDFDRTPEPAGGVTPSETGRLYAIQKHRARQLHYDLRLELDGVLLSWAVPKGPSLDPTVKSLAVRTEDHPIAYASFEGIIPEGEYGAGAVMLWDVGEWEPINEPHNALEKGDLKFRLYGEKLGGSWVLVRMGREKDGRDWLLIKKRDEAARARAEFNILNEKPRSAVSGRTIEEIGADADTVWEGGHAVAKKERTEKRRPRAASARKGLLDPANVPGARKVEQPTTFRPQLAETAKVPPEGDDWIHEVKYDGYRLICIIASGMVRLLTRNGHDWTDRFPSLIPPLSRLPIDNAILDGEVTVLDAAGTPDFGALQSAFKRADRAGFVYFLFDITHAGGHDLTRATLTDRKAYLQRLLRATPEIESTLRFSDHIVGRGPVVAQEASKHGMEGIISKRADSKYRAGRRSADWLKVKFVNREEFIIGGYTQAKGARTGFGALLVGRYDEGGRLVYCGRVGTGFSEATLAELGSRMESIRQAASPFANPPTGADARGVSWIEPALIAEIEYGSWTHDSMLRHPVFVALRQDKDPREVVGGAPKATGGRASATKAPPVVKLSRGAGDEMIGGVRISHPDRVVYPETGHTKGDVARYYDAAADRILAFIGNRPLSVVRCPEGVEGEHFFQKHVGEGFPDAIHGTPISNRGVKHPYLYIKGRDGLLALAQMGVLEIHMWGSRLDKPAKPDLIVFDLDPGPGITWEHVVESARFVRDHLKRLGLESFPKTSGGAGVHVVVPLTRRAGWDEVKAFARAVAEDIVRLAPRNFVATMAKTRREHRVFIDYLRNARGATAVAPYSTRALPLATVSTALRWDELSKNLPPRDLNITTVTHRLAHLEADPWEGFATTRQSITKGMKSAVGLRD